MVAEFNKFQMLHFRITILITFFICATSAAISKNNINHSNTLFFTENKGQISDAGGNLRPDILFTAEDNGISYFIKKSGISYVLHKMDIITEGVNTEKELYENRNYYTHRVDVNFIGSNATTFFEKKNELPGYRNYYYTHCPEGINNVKSYNSITQKNIYNNIDIKYTSTNGNNLKYDLLVKPGGNVNDIVLSYSGQSNLNINEGRIIISTSLGEIYESMPRVYQEIDGKEKNIKAWYEKTNDGNIIIKTNEYNKAYTLYIDPWITYFGGTLFENGTSITTDGSGNIVFVGNTQSTNLPLLGAYQTSMGGVLDAFVTKMNPTGTLIWSTYYGGSTNDIGRGICADETTGDIYFAGITAGGFPIGATVGNTSFVSSYPGVNSAFLVKLNPAGSRLWSTYYGNSVGNTSAYDVATDKNGNVLLYGETAATANISSAGVFQTAHAGGFSDVYLVKFGPTGTRIWATYCGGSGPIGDMAGGVCCDALNNIYIAGVTTSSDFPVTTGCHQAVFGGGGNDAFLFKFDATGQRVWGTYYGGAGTEVTFGATAVQVDLSGNVYIGAGTTSATGISTVGSYQAVKNAGVNDKDAYLAKFSPAGVRLWGTYIGGSTGPSVNSGGTDYITGLAVDKYNNIITGGDTYSSNFPISSCAFQTTFLGIENQFVATFDSLGNKICSGFIGNNLPATLDNEADSYGGCITQTNGYVYLIAFSPCNYPTTPNAFQPACGGDMDAAVLKLCAVSCGIPDTTINFTSTDSLICEGEYINFTLDYNTCNIADTKYEWFFSGASPATSTDKNPTTIIYPSNGTYPVKVKIESPCVNDSITKTSFITVNSLPTLAISNDTTIPAGTSVILTASGANSYSWSPATNLSCINCANPIATPETTTTYCVWGTNGISDCNDTACVTIIVSGYCGNIFIPNAFSPNNDGQNDNYLIKANCVKNFLLTIYNRWGEKVFETTNEKEAWNGTYKDEKMNTEVFVYHLIIELTDNTTLVKKGNISLLR